MNNKKQWKTPIMMLLNGASINSGNICGTNEGFTFGRPPSAFTHMTNNGFTYCSFLTPGGGSAKKSIATITASWGTDAETGACTGVAVPSNCGAS